MKESSRSVTNKKCQRRIQRFIINPSVQWRYTATAVVGVFIVSAFVSVLLYGVMFDQARSRMLPGATSSSLDVTLSVITASVAFAAVPAIACGLWAIVMTHRLCGPVRVLESHLRELAAGRFPKHRSLRKKDNFRDVYKVFWQAVDTLKKTRTEHITALCGMRDRAQQSLSSNEDTRAALASIASRLDDICCGAGAEFVIDDTSAKNLYEPPRTEPTVAQPELAESTTTG